MTGVWSCFKNGASHAVFQIVKILHSNIVFHCFKNIVHQLPQFSIQLIASFKVLKLMCFICKKNDKRTKKPVSIFWQDGAKAGIQTFTEIKLCQTPGNGLWTRLWGKYVGQLAQQLTMRRKLTSRGCEIHLWNFQAILFLKWKRQFFDRRQC